MPCVRAMHSGTAESAPSVIEMTSCQWQTSCSPGWQCPWTGLSSCTRAHTSLITSMVTVYATELISSLDPRLGFLAHLEGTCRDNN